MSLPLNISLVLILSLLVRLRVPSTQLAQLAFVSRFDLDFDFDIDIVYFDYLRHFDLAPFDYDCLRLLLILSYPPPPPPLSPHQAASYMVLRFYLTREPSSDRDEDRCLPTCSDVCCSLPLLRR